MNDHNLICECSICQKEPDYWVGKRFTARRKIINAKLESYIKILNFLGIKYHLGNQDVQIPGDELLPLLIDPEKCDQLISKLKNRAFW